MIRWMHGETRFELWYDPHSLASFTSRVTAPEEWEFSDEFGFLPQSALLDMAAQVSERAAIEDPLRKSELRSIAKMLHTTALSFAMASMMPAELHEDRMAENEPMGWERIEERGRFSERTIHTPSAEAVERVERLQRKNIL